MRSDYTHISMLLDRSGSMEKIKNDIIGGFNSFIENQKKVPGVLSISLSQFDDNYEVLYEMKNIHDVNPLTEETYVPRGTTALYDFTAKLVNDTGKDLSNMQEHDRPAKVLFVILTDGLENSSKEYTAEAVEKMVTHQKEVYNWKFIYIGANQDAFKVASKIGVRGVNFSASAVGTYALFNSLNSATVNYRTSTANSFTLSQEDIKLDDADKKFILQKEKIK